MNKQLDEMKGSTKAAQDATYVACVGAQIARKSLFDAESGGADTHNLTVGSITQAAAVTRASAARVDFFRAKVTANIHENQPITIPLGIENVGQSEALKVHVQSQVRLVEAGTEADFTYSRPAMNYEDTGALFQGDGSTLTFKSRADGQDIVLSKQDFLRLQESTAYVIAYGKVDYQNIFGVPHWATFCLQFTVNDVNPSKHQKCASYNSADSNLAFPRQAIRSPHEPTMPEIICKRDE